MSTQIHFTQTMNLLYVCVLADDDDIDPDKLDIGTLRLPQSLTMAPAKQTLPPAPPAVKSKRKHSDGGEASGSAASGGGGGNGESALKKVKIEQGVGTY